MTSTHHRQARSRLLMAAITTLVESGLMTQSPAGYGYGQATPPAGTFEEVSAGGDPYHSSYTCGTRTDGSVTCWGEGYSGQAAPPTGTFKGVTTGVQHSRPVPHLWTPGERHGRLLGRQ